MFEIPDSYVKTSIPHYSIWRGATWGRMESDGDGLDFGRLNISHKIIFLMLSWAQSFKPLLDLEEY